MNFDTLCSVILEGKKAQQFARIAVTNPNPSFSIDDVLRDPNDPSKGVKTYLDDQLKKTEEGEMDDERLARRALRRLNWVAGSIVKRIGSRELDLRKLHINIILLLEKYLTNVLRYSDDQISNMELKIAKEAAFIGNMMLPPSTRYPNAKGVFTNVKEEEIKKKGTDKDISFNVADVLSKQFNMTVDEYLAAYDPDLIGTIKEVIRDGAAQKGNEGGVEWNVPTGKTSILQSIIQQVFDAPDLESAKEIAIDRITNSRIPGGLKKRMLFNINSIQNLSRLQNYIKNSMFKQLGLGDTSSPVGESIQTESTGIGGAAISDILKDPRIKNIYDPRIVRKVIKNMVEMGSLLSNEDGTVSLTEPGEEGWRVGMDRARNRAVGAPVESPAEEFPEEGDVEGLSQTFADEKEPTDAELQTIEDEENTDEEGVSGIAARRLGYKKASSEPEDEDTEDEDDTWYK
ncbi:MAG: hypothetical protein PHS54_00285 [Clostridia bacterium]|nr:hypothetical protein [Clostridia bacterium]